MTLQEYMDMGGNPKPGLDLFTNPVVKTLPYHGYEGENSKHYTFVEIVKDKGVRVKEKSDWLLGTGWLYLVHEVALSEDDEITHNSFFGENINRVRKTFDKPNEEPKPNYLHEDDFYRQRWIDSENEKNRIWNEQNDKKHGK